MHINLWNAPFNGGWIWFDRKNILSFRAVWVRSEHKLFVCGFGLHLKLIVQTAPWHGRRWPKHFKNRNGDNV